MFTAPFYDFHHGERYEPEIRSFMEKTAWSTRLGRMRQRGVREFGRIFGQRGAQKKNEAVPPRLWRWVWCRGTTNKLCRSNHVCGRGSGVEVQRTTSAGLTTSVGVGLPVDAWVGQRWAQSGRTGMNVPEGHHTVWRRKAVCAIGSPTYDVRYTKVNVLSEFSTRNKSPKCNMCHPESYCFLHSN